MLEESRCKHGFRCLCCLLDQVKGLKGTSTQIKMSGSCLPYSIISVSRRLIDWKKALIWGKTQREVGEPDVFIVRFCIVCHLVFQLFSVFGWFGLTAGDKLSVFLNVKDRGFCL